MYKATYYYTVSTTAAQAYAHLEDDKACVSLHLVIYFDILFSSFIVFELLIGLYLLWTLLFLRISMGGVNDLPSDKLYLITTYGTRTDLNIVMFTLN